MKKFFALVALTFSMPNLAATAYISDELRVPLRSSPCATCAIVHSGLIAGTSLTVLEQGDEWSQVRTGNGLTGWLPSQYLVEQPIARDRLARVLERNQTLETENSTLQEQLATLEQAQTSSETDLAESISTRQELEQELAALKQISGNALTLQEQNEELVKRNRMLQSEVDVLTASRDQLLRDNRQSWFIYGAVAVFLGALLTLLIPRLKPRRRFSEWV